MMNYLQALEASQIQLVKVWALSLTLTLTELVLIRTSVVLLFLLYLFLFVVIASLHILGAAQPTARSSVTDLQTLADVADNY